MSPLTDLTIGKATGGNEAGNVTFSGTPSKVVTAALDSRGKPENDIATFTVFIPRERRA